MLQNLPEILDGEEFKSLPDNLKIKELIFLAREQHKLIMSLTESMQGFTRALSSDNVETVKILNRLGL